MNGVRNLVDRLRVLRVVQDVPDRPSAGVRIADFRRARTPLRKPDPMLDVRGQPSWRPYRQERPKDAQSHAKQPRGSTHHKPSPPPVRLRRQSTRKTPRNRPSPHARNIDQATPPPPAVQLE